MVSGLLVAVAVGRCKRARRRCWSTPSLRPIASCALLVLKGHAPLAGLWHSGYSGRWAVPGRVSRGAVPGRVARGPYDAGTGAPRPRGRDVATLHRSQAAAVPRYETQRLCGQSCACAVLRRNATPRRVQMQYRKGARQRCNHSSHSDINYDVGLAAAVNTPLAPTMAIARKHCIPPASMAATVDRVDRSRRDAPHFEPTQQQPTRGCDVATHRSQPVAVRTRPSARAHQYAWL